MINNLALALGRQMKQQLISQQWQNCACARTHIFCYAEFALPLFSNCKIHKSASFPGRWTVRKSHSPFLLAPPFSKLVLKTKNPGNWPTCDVTFELPPLFLPSLKTSVRSSKAIGFVLFGFLVVFFLQETVN